MAYFVSNEIIADYVNESAADTRGTSLATLSNAGDALLRQAEGQSVCNTASGDEMEQPQALVGVVHR
jgi:hypothetical protein